MVHSFQTNRHSINTGTTAVILLLFRQELVLTKPKNFLIKFIKCTYYALFEKELKNKSLTIICQLQIVNSIGKIRNIDRILFPCKCFNTTIPY